MSDVSRLARPYRPDDAFTQAGVLALAAAMVVAGALLGFLGHVAGQHFYLILLFPMLIGAALGAVAAYVVRRTGMRNPLVAGVVALLGGIAAMSMMHLFDYRTFRGAQAEAIAKDAPFAAEVRASDAPVPFVDPEPAPVANPRFAVPVPITVAMDKAKRAADFQRYVDFLRVRSFADYMDFEARQGVTIKGNRSSSTPMNLGYAGSYVYWGVEALIVAAIAFGMAYVQSRRPYCAACGAWKAERPVGYFRADPAAVASAVGEGDVGRLRASDPTLEPTAALLHVAACPNGPACRATPPEDEVRVERRRYDRKGAVAQRKTIAHAVWPATATPQLDALFAPPPVDRATER